MMITDDAEGCLLKNYEKTKGQLVFPDDMPTNQALAYTASVQCAQATHHYNQLRDGQQAILEKLPGNKRKKNSDEGLWQCIDPPGNAFFWTESWYKGSQKSLKGLIAVQGADGSWVQTREESDWFAETKLKALENKKHKGDLENKYVKIVAGKVPKYVEDWLYKNPVGQVKKSNPKSCSVCFEIETQTGKVMESVSLPNQVLEPSETSSCKIQDLNEDGELRVRMPKKTHCQCTVGDIEFVARVENYKGNGEGAKGDTVTLRIAPGFQRDFLRSEVNLGEEKHEPEGNSLEIQDKLRNYGQIAIGQPQQATVKFMGKEFNIVYLVEKAEGNDISIKVLGESKNIYMNFPSSTFKKRKAACLEHTDPTEWGQFEKQVLKKAAQKQGNFILKKENSIRLAKCGGRKPKKDIVIQILPLVENEKVDANELRKIFNAKHAKLNADVHPLDGYCDLIFEYEGGQRWNVKADLSWLGKYLVIDDQPSLNRSPTAREGQRVQLGDNTGIVTNISGDDATVELPAGQELKAKLSDLWVLDPSAEYQGNEDASEQEDESSSDSDDSE